MKINEFADLTAALKDRGVTRDALINVITSIYASQERKETEP